MASPSFPKGVNRSSSSSIAEENDSGEASQSVPAMDSPSKTGMVMSPKESALDSAYN